MTTPHLNGYRQSKKKSNAKHHGALQPDLTSKVLLSRRPAKTLARGYPHYTLKRETSLLPYLVLFDDVARFEDP